MQKMGPYIRTYLSGGPEHRDTIWYGNLLKGALELNTKVRPSVKYKLPSSTTLATKTSIMRHIEDEMLYVRSMLPDWMLREIKYDSEYHPGVTVEGGIRAYAKWDGGIHIAHNQNWSVIVHEMFHELDHALSGYGDMGPTMNWGLADDEVERLAAAVRKEFLERDSKGNGRFTNGDGDYALGNWRQNYEARLYRQNKEGISSEYITMNAQYYLEAYNKGARQFLEERKTMKRLSPAMLDLLDHIFIKKGGWRLIEDAAEEAQAVKGFKVTEVATNKDAWEAFSATPERLTKLDPTDFGLEKWPEHLDKLPKANWNAIKSDAYFVMYHLNMPGGQPKRYQSLLRRKIEGLRKKGLL